MDRHPATQLALRWLLAPPSAVYSLAVQIRNRRYDRDPSRSCEAEVAVISVGNITAGGTGKTPIVIEIVRLLTEMGCRPAILTRGYAAARGETADEVIEFAEALPDVPVVVNADRVAGARIAGRDFHADCAVMDDGFQHRRLRRDLDIVLIDALDPWGGGWVLPAGRLREPLRGLRRADVFIITRSNQADPAALNEIKSVLREEPAAAPIVHADVVPEVVVFADGRTDQPSVLGYHSVLPVCGIGNPSTFLRAIQSLAGRLCEPLVFRDHQRYSHRHMRRILATAQRRAADLVVTTRKDWGKLAPLWSVVGGEDAPDLARLGVRLVLQDEENVLDVLLRRAVEKHA